MAPEKFALSMAAGFKKACPDTFAVTPFGAQKFGAQEGFVAVAGCGRVETSADRHGETALLVAVKGSGRCLYDPVGGARAVVRGQARDRRGEVAGTAEQAATDPLLRNRAGRSRAVSELREQELAVGRVVTRLFIVAERQITLR